MANETDADLIVIGLRRRTPVGKLILGSNAQRILLDAPCAGARRQGPTAEDDDPTERHRSEPGERPIRLSGARPDAAPRRCARTPRRVL